MGDRSCKDVLKRRGGGVLYEPPEPLFPDLIRRRHGNIVKVMAFIAFIGILAAVLAVAVIGDDREGGSGNGFFDRGDLVGESSDQEKTEHVREELSEARESESLPCEHVTEMASEAVSENGTDPASNGSAETEESDPQDGYRDNIKEVDLSWSERGESFIFNYSEREADISGLIDRGFIYKEERSSAAPLVMVIHTHTSEKYYSGNSEAAALSGVAAVGDVLNIRLNSFGLSSIHCTVIHDVGNENAYRAARETIKTMLKIYPSIRYVIDLHRMQIKEDGLVARTFSGSADGSAQIRLSVSAESGPAWQEELSLALALRDRLNRNGERICMPVLLSASRYNSDLCEYYIMVDIGSSGNTFDEASAAAHRLARAMSDVILEAG